MADEGGDRLAVVVSDIVLETTELLANCPLRTRGNWIPASTDEGRISNSSAISELSEDVIEQFGRAEYLLCCAILVVLGLLASVYMCVNECAFSYGSC